MLFPLETSCCLRSRSAFGTQSRNHKKSQREACETVLEGLQSSHSLTKLDIKRPLLWDNDTGYGCPAPKLGTAIFRDSEIEQGILGGRGLNPQIEKSCRNASSRV